MSDKVQLIKEEIERRIKNLEFSLENNCVEKHSKLDILGNITTLESLLQFLESIPEPASEDLEEEMIRWHKEHFGNKRDWEKTSGEYLTRKTQLDIARHFAEWQEKKMLGIAEAFYQQGRYEQEQEMMKDVVDGEYWIGEIHLDTPIIQGYDDGDRIKFIPIKTEQQ